MTRKAKAGRFPILIFLLAFLAAAVITSGLFLLHPPKQSSTKDQINPFIAIMSMGAGAALGAIPALWEIRSAARRTRAREDEQQKREAQARARLSKAEENLLNQTLKSASWRTFKSELTEAYRRGTAYLPEDKLEQPEPPDTPELEAPTTPPDLLSLSALWEVTHSRLDLYHELATGQADRSFRNAQRAMTAGFALIVCFAVLGAFFSRNTAGSVVAGTLGVVGAGFAGYISRTFVRSQEAAAVHLREYFGQPLEFSRYLAAERMLNAVEGIEAAQRAEIAGKLLLGLFSIQFPDQTPSGTNSASPNGDPQSNGSATASKPAEG